MRIKEIIANLSATKTTQTTPLYQWDFGQVLRVIGTKISAPIQIHFSNGNDEALVVLAEVEGNDLVANIPDELLEVYRNIMAYIYYTDDDSGQTVYKINIPVLARQKPEDYEPTEHEKTLVEEAIEALEKNLLTVETEKTEGGSKLIITDRNGRHIILLLDGEQGEPGFSPTVSITAIEGGNRISITDENGVHSADILNGIDGTPGAPGYSPAVTIEPIEGGNRLTITDETGSHSADIMNGAKGDHGIQGVQGEPGFSPTVTITAITGGNRITITDENGAHTADVMNGADGNDYVLTAQDKTEIADIVIQEIGSADTMSF